MKLAWVSGISKKNSKPMNTIIFLTHFMVKGTNQQVLLQNTDLGQKYLVTDSQKMWGAYLNASFDLSPQFHQISLTRSLWYFKCTSKAFLKKSNGTIDLKLLVLPKLLGLRVASFYFAFIVQPIARFEYTNMTDRRYRLPRPLMVTAAQTVAPIYRLKHFVHRLLRMNITFHHIYFSTKSSKGCQFNNLTVSTCEHTENMTGPGSVTYCGINPSSQFLSSCSDVHVLTYLDGFMTHSTSVIFSVISSTFINSNPFGHKANVYAPKWLSNPQAFLLDALFFHNNDILIKVFSVETTKSFQIHLFFNNSADTVFAKVHDGPGPLTREVVPRAKGLGSSSISHFITTTFHCTLYTVESFNSVTFSSRKHHSHQKNVFIHPGTNITFQAPGSNVCVHPRFCVVSMRTEPEFHVKLSTSNIWYQGNNNAECGFSGIAAHDGHNEFLDCPKIFPTNTELRADMKHLYSFRDVYSSANNLIFVFYSFTEYSDLAIEAHVSLSNCKRKLLNLCDNIYPLGEYIGRNSYDIMLSLDKVFFITSNPYSAGYSTKYFTGDAASDCWVLQLAHDLSREKNLIILSFPAKDIRYDCLAKIVIEPKLLSNQEFNIVVHGFFRGR